MKETIGVVYQEDDYSVFQNLLGNRSIDEYRKQKIRNSIKKVGWIKNPIVVNEKLQVIDGQARLEVLKEMGLPVQYVIAYGSGIDECISMNIGQTNWKSKDYIASYAVRGNQSYARLLKLIDDFESFKIQEIMGAAKNTIVGNGYKAGYFKSGNFSMSEEDFNETYAALESAERFLPIVDRIPGSSRVKRTAVMWILKNTKANADRLYKNLSKQYPKVSPVVDQREDIFLSELSDIYNKGLSAKNCIYFETEYKQFVRENG